MGRTTVLRFLEIVIFPGTWKHRVDGGEFRSVGIDPFPLLHFLTLNMYMQQSFRGEKRTQKQRGEEEKETSNDYAKYERSLRFKFSQFALYRWSFYFFLPLLFVFSLLQSLTNTSIRNFFSVLITHSQHASETRTIDREV